jgi:hypothetical protein
MQWVGKKQKPRHDIGLLGGEHGALAPTVRMPAEKDASCRFGPQSFHSTTQTLTVAGSHGGKRWSVGTRLPKRQIATQDQISSVCESLCQRDQQFALAICAGSMSQDQRITVRL